MNKGIIFTILTLFFTFFLKAQTTAIPDANFEDYLETHTADGVSVAVGDPLSMGDGIANNGVVTTANISTVTSLNVSNSNIEDLTGIQDFTDLSTLICSDNNLRNLDVSTNTNLTTLLCGINQLTVLDVSNNNALEVLNCSSNQINTIDVSNNLVLERLSCGENRITVLDISLNTELFFLSVSENLLANLDVSANTKLEQLFCASNQLNTLNLANNTLLSTLNASQNKITNFDLSALNTVVCTDPQTDPITKCQSDASINVSNNQLVTLIVSNGYNDLITSFSSEGNPDLNCIQVDGGFTPNTNWLKDDWTYYSNAICSDIYTYVPDDNFEQALVDLNLDDALDNLVLTANINTLANLDISNLNIEDLTGIEDFTSLELLNCSFNSLQDIDVSNNIALTTLNTSNNDLSNIDLSANTLLEVLDVSFNNLKILELVDNTALIDVNCSNNSLSILNFETLTGLMTLNCEVNNLEVLNIKNGQNPNLANFNATSNPDLSCIETDTGAEPVGVNWVVDVTSSYAVLCGTYVPDDGFEQALIDLGFDNAPLDNYVPTGNIVGETNLDVSNYNITDLTGIQDFLALQVFNCANNAIVELDLSANTALTNITCSNNALEFVDIRNGNNAVITAFDAINNPNLYCINVDIGVIGNIPAGWTKDPIANYNSDCELNRFTPIPDNNFEQALIDLGIDNGPLDNQVLTSSIEYLNALNVSGKNIESLEGIQSFLSLTELDCSNNFLDELDLSGMLNLEALYCSSNYFLTNNSANINGVLNIDGVNNLSVLFCSGNLLADLNVSDKMNLQNLDCSDNKITNLDISSNALLQDLNCSSNAIANLDISDLSVLETVNCSNNTIINLITSAAVNATLKILNCSNNNLDVLQINAYSALEDLSCNSNTISNLNITNNQLLSNLNCSDNSLVNLDLTQNPNLINLYTSQNDLTQLNLSNNVVLEYADCNYNAILNLELGAITNLEYLYANNNEIDQLDASNNLNLIVLDVSFNDITNLILPNDLSQLKALNVSNNLLENALDLSSMGIGVCPNGNDRCPQTISINASNNLYDFINIQNGINDEIQSFNATSNPNLNCIQVDDVNNIGANWLKDATSEYNIDCRFGETYVPDDNFEQALIDLGYDTAPLDDYVPTINIEALTFLNVNGKGISDLTGIEDFVALQNFKCADNNISVIDVSNNSALEEINCANNSIETLDLSTLTNIINVDISNNRFAEFDVSLIPTLKVFKCDGNSLVELDFSTNIILVELSCALNILEVLNIQNGQNENLLNLSAQNNPNLSCIQTDNGTVPGGVTWLKDDIAEYTIDCHFGETYVPDDNFEQALIDLGYDDAPLDNYVLTANIQNQTFLNISGNEISDLTGIEDFEALQSLNFENNLIQNVDLSNNTQLVSLNGSDNLLSEVNISNQTDLKVLNVSNNNITQINLDSNLDVLELDVSSNSITELDISFLLDLEKLNCASNLLMELDATFNTKLVELICSSNLFFQDNLNIQNGANGTLVIFNASGNPDLSCILVDDPVAVIANVSGLYDNWIKDATTNYQSICDDADNDGVANEDDLCPGTPFGEPVDLFGCAYIGLPEDNFTILITGETCLNNNDGKINITSNEFYEYRATLKGDDFDRTYTFTNEIEILNLLAGAYRLCITSEEIPNFERCFDIVINHPENLDVITGKQENGKVVHVQMSGSSNYIIDFNGLIFPTNNSEITLQLEPGENNIKVSTDKPCQGSYEERIFLSDEIAIYPVPFKDELHIYLGDIEDDKVNISMYSYLGQLVYFEESNGRNERSLTVKTDAFSSGLYTVFVTSKASVSTFKIIKQ
ncbi:MAG: T9SS type A sorting domain-containing protein [Jejuia sp.]